LFGDEISLSYLTHNEYEESLSSQVGGSPYNMLCNTEQQGYNIRSKYVLQKEKCVPQKDKPAPQKDKPIVPAVQIGGKNLEKI